MSTNASLNTAIVSVSLLAAGVMYGMFAVGTFEDFEKSRLYFAAAVLAFIAFIFLFAIIIHGLGPDAQAGREQAGKALLDVCAKVLPPIATLVIGFYFGAAPNKAEVRA